MGASATEGSPYPSLPAVPFEHCPIATSLQFLGRKWTLTVLRDIAFFPKATFAVIRKGNHDITARVLSLRLRQLAAEDLVRKVVPPENPRHPYYELTSKGLEVWPILASLFQYGIRNHAQTVFADGKPRDLGQMYPTDAGLLLGPLGPYADTLDRATTAPSSAGTAYRASSGTSRRR